MTPDIVKLRDALPTLESIIERLELQLVDDPAWGEPSDTSYLTDADRQDPDIAANVDAMAETNKLIAWFGRDAEGYLGLWRGPSGRTLDEAPVVRLDSEGQYSIVAATVPEYLAIAMPEDEFASTRETLTRAGFTVGFNPDAIWGALEAFDDDPNAYRNELYEQNRVARGLPRTDAADAGDDTDNMDIGDDISAVPEPNDFAAGSQPALPALDLDDDEDDEAETEEDAEEDEAPAFVAPHVTPGTRAAGAAAKPAANQASKSAPTKPPAKAKQAAAKPVKKAATAPAKKAAKPAAKQAAKPAAKKAAKPAAKQAAKPAAKKAAKPAAKPAAKKAAKPAKKRR